MKRWFKVSVVRFDIAGETRVMVRHQDITDAVVVEDCLSETMHPSEDPGHQGRDGIFILQDEHIVFVNHALAQLMCISPDQLLGRRLTDLMTPRQASQWRRRLAPRAERRQRRGEGRMVLQVPGGMPLDVTMTVTATLYNGLPALLGTLHRST